LASTLHLTVLAFCIIIVSFRSQNILDLLRTKSCWKLWPTSLHRGLSGTVEAVFSQKLFSEEGKGGKVAVTGVTLDREGLVLNKSGGQGGRRMVVER
jgi:hypothetical protein